MNFKRVGKFLIEFPHFDDGEGTG